MELVDIALTRDVAATIDRCELSFAEREPIDVSRAVAQHRDYCERLERAGLEVERLPADPDCPDCCFVEDTAVVLDQVAVVTVPGAEARRAETPVVAQALARHRRVERMTPPATLDGGDVLALGRRLFVGRTARSNDAGRAFLAAVVAPFGYDVTPVDVRGCLHLKSAVTALDEETLVGNPDWFDVAALTGYRLVAVDPSEPAAGNVLRVRDRVWAHAGFPRTLDRLEREGHRVEPVDVSEFVKAEAGLTCKSLLLRRVPG